MLYAYIHDIEPEIFAGFIAQVGQRNIARKLAQGFQESWVDQFNSSKEKSVISTHAALKKKVSDA